MPEGKEALGQVFPSCGAKELALSFVKTRYVFQPQNHNLSAFFSYTGKAKADLLFLNGQSL